MKNILKVAIILSVIGSCIKLPEVPPADFSFGGGVFILNEGNFRGGNGSLSFYSYDSLKIFNNLFYTVNGRPLGDVPNSISIYSDKAYIVVNNSGKIEVIDNTTLVSKATISGLISPRQMAIINDNKAYVSSLYSDSVAIINLFDNSISGYINLRRSSEAIVIAGNKAFISNWSGGKEIMVINTINNQVIDSIEVGTEPESMVLDRNKMVWVLCNGGWARQNFAELNLINTGTNHIEKKYVFPTKEASPSCLQIDGIGQTIFYIDKGVWQMGINSSDLPATPLIPESGAYFYKIAINPINSDIFISDAVDFMQPGFLLCYKNNGAFVSKQRADIIPGSMCFKLRIDTHTK
ncbi:MAG: YncE family protein [Bacteroidetes bacterium]|nr:MAG: YncE family protein [Bacteroidota bacterium]